MAILAVVSCLILIGGWLARPRDNPQNPPPVPTETELEQLTKRAERRSLDDMKKYFAGIAREVESAVSHIRGPDVSGIAWDQSRVVTSPLGQRWSRGPLNLTAARGETQGQPTMDGPNLPLSVVAIAPGAPRLTPASQAHATPVAGDWVVAVWRSDTAAAFAVGNFRQAAVLTCGVVAVREIVSSLSLTTTMIGGGVFDVDGGLLAVILPCGGRLVAVATASIQSLFDRGESADQRLQSRYGFAVGALSAEEMDYFRSREGLLVREVWTGYAADRAGIRPGDIITAVNDKTVSTADELAALTTSSATPILLTIRRARKSLNVPLPNGPQEPAGGEAGGVGLSMEEPSAKTYPIEAVRPGSPAARAGIRPGDRLVRIDQAEPRSLQQIRRILSGSQQRALWLEVARDRRRLGVLLHEGHTP